MSSSEPSSWSSYPNNNYGFSRRMMIAAIVCFLIVSLFVVLLHIYGKWLMRRRIPNDPFLPIWSSPVAPGRLRVPSAGTPTTPKTGLDASLLASVPVFLYRKAEHSERSECTICLSLLEEEDEAKSLPNCRHCFHSLCIDAWLQLDSTCPVCRATVVVVAHEAEKRDGEPEIEVGNSDPIGRDDGLVVVVVGAASELDYIAAVEDMGRGGGGSSSEPVAVGEISGESVSVEQGEDPLVGGGTGVCSFGSLRRMLGRNRSERKSPRTNPDDEELETEKV